MNASVLPPEYISCARHCWCAYKEDDPVVLRLGAEVIVRGFKAMPHEHGQPGTCPACLLEVGDMLNCPSCGLKFRLETWQVEDGPCKDGRFYCLRPCCGCEDPHQRRKSERAF